MPTTLKREPIKRLTALEEHDTKLLKTKTGGPKLVFDKEIQPRWENEYTMGKIYLGYVYFEGKQRQPVVIKEVDWNKDFFYSSDLSIGANGKIDTVISGIKQIFSACGLVATPEIIAREYNQVIIKLRNSGVRLPKMKAIVLNEKLLIVSQYIGNSMRRKLIKDVNEIYTNEILFPQALSVCADLINNGFVPTHDILEVFTLQDGSRTVMPLDIDLQVYFFIKEKFKQSDFKSDVVMCLLRFIRLNKKTIKIIAKFIKNITNREIQHRLINELLKFKDNADFNYYYPRLAKELGLDLARYLLTYIDLEKFPGLENYYNRLLARVNDDQLDLFPKENK